MTYHNGETIVILNRVAILVPLLKIQLTNKFESPVAKR